MLSKMTYLGEKKMFKNDHLPGMQGDPINPS